MRLHCSVFIATSLDGYIARPDGSIDWLPAPDPAIGDYGYEAFMTTIDAVVLGRHTYDTVRGFGAWPYGERRVVVLSRGAPEIPPELARRVSTASSPQAALDALRAADCHHAYVDGGLAVQAFLRDGLLDDITLSTVPVLLGAGRPLFGVLSADVRLVHQSTQAFATGLVQSTYRVAHVAA